MDIKECLNCKTGFVNKHKEQVFCGRDCYRKFNHFKEPIPLAIKLPTPPHVATVSNRLELPDPDQLPAPYAKRVYDMWRVLIGESSAPVRIA